MRDKMKPIIKFSQSIRKSAEISATKAFIDKFKVSLFPNPAGTNLTLKLFVIQYNEQVKIHNTMERLVKEVNASAISQQINIEELSKGV
jgi:hypothetical protein